MNNKPLEGPELVDKDDDNIDPTTLADGLDREEQEVADDEDKDIGKNIVVDMEETEETMKEEVLKVAKKVKPIQCVLFNVCCSRFVEFAYYIINASCY